MRLIIFAVVLVLAVLACSPVTLEVWDGPDLHTFTYEVQGSAPGDYIPPSPPAPVFASPTPVAAPCTATATGWVNLRVAPVTGGVMVSIPPGAGVAVNDYHAGWLGVYYHDGSSGFNGWSSAQFFTINPPGCHLQGVSE